jgi:hypothetical protein
MLSHSFYYPLFLTIFAKSGWASKGVRTSLSIVVLESVFLTASEYFVQSSNDILDLIGGNILTTLESNPLTQDLI